MVILSYIPPKAATNFVACSESDNFVACSESDTISVKAEIVFSATEIVFSVLLQLGWSEA